MMIWQSTLHCSHLYFLVCRKFPLQRVFFFKKRIDICLTKVFKSKYERRQLTDAFWELETRDQCFQVFFFFKEARNWVFMETLQVFKCLQQVLDVRVGL